MVSLGLDYSVPHTETQLARLKGKGAGFVVRYLCPPKYPKRLTRAEAQVISRVGLNLVSVFQWDGTKREWFSGNRGTRDANIALENAREVGQPKGSAIYFAVDYNTGPDDISTLRKYFTQVKAALGDRYRAGVYGSHHTIEALKDLVPYRWQTYAWSAGKVSADTNMVQFLNGAGWAGGQNDLNLAFGDPGFWRPDGAPYDAQPLSLPPLEQGSRGYPVAALQALLARLQIDAGPIDGIYGPKTEAAVRAFQKTTYGWMDNLAETGTADASTVEALLAHQETQKDDETASEVDRLNALLAEKEEIIARLEADNDRLAAAMKEAIRLLDSTLYSDPS